MDDTAASMVLVNWEGHKLAKATTSPRQRMEKAFNVFIRYLPGAHTWCADDITSKPISVQSRISEWRRTLTVLSVALGQWWCSWSAGAPRDDQLPADTDWDSLSDRLHVVITQALSRGPSLAIARRFPVEEAERAVQVLSVVVGPAPAKVVVGREAVRALIAPDDLIESTGLELP